MWYKDKGVTMPRVQSLEPRRCKARVISDTSILLFGVKQLSCLEYSDSETVLRLYVVSEDSTSLVYLVSEGQKRQHNLLIITKQWSRGPITPMCVYLGTPALQYDVHV